MRALHTADLHLGHSLNGWDRVMEHEIWMEHVAGIIEARQIDVLLISGDVFDNVNPSGEIQEQFYRWLADIKSRRAGLVTIITGGNHDPALRLEAPSTLLSALDIHVFGTVRRRAGEVDLDQMMIPLGDPDDPEAFVLAIPFLRASDLPGLRFTRGKNHDSPVVTAATGFFDRLTARAAEIANGKPIILMSHLHCEGGIESEGAERRVLIGGAHALPAHVFPPALNYIALGHLHRPHSLDGGRLRYPGSCFPLSAGEIGHEHGVTIVEFDRQGRFEHAHIAIPRPAEMYRIPRSGVTDLAGLTEALDALGASPELAIGLRPLVYVELEASDAAAVLLNEAERILSGYPVRNAGVRVRRQQAELNLPQFDSLDETNPEELFVEAFLRANGQEAEERHLSAFRDAVAGVK